MTSKAAEQRRENYVDEVIAPIPVKRYLGNSVAMKTPSRNTADSNFEKLTEDEINKDFNSFKTKSEIHYVHDEIVSILTRSDIDFEEFKPISKVKSTAF